MSRYEELCEAYADAEPHMLAIDAIFQEFPEKLRQALTEYLEVPRGPAPLAPWLMGGRSVTYIEFYRAMLVQRGARKYEPCAAGDCLQLDDDDLWHFTLGICVERKATAAPASLMSVDFAIESINEDAAVISFAKTGEKVRIDLRDPAGYANAAAHITAYLLERMKHQLDSGGRAGPIGF